MYVAIVQNRCGSLVLYLAKLPTYTNYYSTFRAPILSGLEGILILPIVKTDYFLRLHIPSKLGVRVVLTQVAHVYISKSVFGLPYNNI